MSKAKQTTPMTFAELVDNTVEYYTTNPRSLQFPDGPCVYEGPNGERCAAARLCDESATDLEAMDIVHDTSWNEVYHFATLKPEYAHFNNDQISALQCMHDTHENWLKPDGERGTEGLSEIGKYAVEFIKSKYQTP